MRGDELYRGRQRAANLPTPYKQHSERHWKDLPRLLGRAVAGQRLGWQGDSWRRMGHDGEFDHPKASLLGSAGTKRRRRHSAAAWSGRWLLIRNGFVAYRLLASSRLGQGQGQGLHGAGAGAGALNIGHGWCRKTRAVNHSSALARRSHVLAPSLSLATRSPPTPLSKLPPGNHKNTSLDHPRHDYLRRCGAGHADQRRRQAVNSFGDQNAGRRPHPYHGPSCNSMLQHVPVGCTLVALSFGPLP
jgi:hypothetical protein